MRFDLRLYNLGATWIDQNLDSIVANHVRAWLEMPISCCVKEMMTLPINNMGFNVPLLKNLSEQLWLQKRNTLKMSPHSDINQIWSDTSGKHISSDSLLTTGTYSMAVKTLKAEQIKKATNHVNMLEIQGI